GSPGITREDLQRGAGIITVAVSAALDAELERTAELIHTQRRGEPARRAGSTTTEGLQPAQPGAGTGSGAAHGAGAQAHTSPKGDGPAQAPAGGLVLPARLAWLAPDLPASISRADRAA